MFNLIRSTSQQARKARLAQVAGSLTFTTVLSIVPLLAVSFALFRRFPIFSRLETAIDEFVLKGLLPADISRTVLKHLNAFATNAGGLTWIGSLFLLATALALLLTVENALNQMWQAKRNRPFLKRLALYALMLVIGPPVLGLSLWAGTVVLGMSMGLMGTLPPSLSFVLDMGPWVLSVVALTALFFYVPNAKVRLLDAFAGGLIASVAFELGKRGFTTYLVKLPTYKAVYGAFAVLPLFLLWMYYSWLVTLVSAMISANLGRARR